MLQTIIKSNSYQDSVVLMLLTSKINQLPYVERVSIMMGTPANKDILKSGGFDTPEMEEASSNDMLIMLEMNEEGSLDEVLLAIDEQLKSQNDDKGEVKESIKSWDKALQQLPDANVALISIPGTYASLEVEKALDNGLHAFVFSDNVPLEDEARLKQKAHEKGLIVMGPDCGTGVIHSLPLAFTNNIRKGRIGIVGASGTGIQEVTTLIHRYGSGVTNVIGTGGRDLSTAVGATSMIDGILALNEDADTDVIAVISKPPAKEIEEKVMNVLRKVEKPVVTLFIGTKPEAHEEGIYRAYTLEETAQLATKLLNKEEVTYTPAPIKEVAVKLQANQVGIKGYYSGGTLAYEAAVLLEDALNLKESTHEEGFILQNGPHEIIDLGDDIYTNGKPHPMIDPEIRVGKIMQVASQVETAVVLFDVVLGYGAHENMAQELANAITKVKAELATQNREVAFVGMMVGTDADFQGYDEQISILEDAGVIVCQNNVQAVRTAINLIGEELVLVEKEIAPKVTSTLVGDLPKVSEQMLTLLSEKPKVINIGLQSFTESITDNGGTVVHYDWRPSAGGDVKLQKILYFLDHYQFDNETSKGDK